MRNTLVAWAIFGALVPVLCGCGGDKATEPFTLWTVGYDDFTDDTATVSAHGENFVLTLSLGCDSDGSVSVLLGFSGLGFFEGGAQTVEVRWDDGDIQRLAFEVSDDLFTSRASDGDARRAFVRELAAHRELRMRVPKAPDDELASDRFDLTGSVRDYLGDGMLADTPSLAAAIAKLECVGDDGGRR